MRAYDPTIGRFLARDPLGRAPLFLAGSDNSSVYAGNNPITNVDPSGQRALGASSSQVKHAAVKQGQAHTRVRTTKGSPKRWALHLHSVAVGRVSLQLHFSLLPNWWDWGDFAKAVGLAVAAGALIAASVLLWASAEIDPLNAVLGVVAFVNALDALVHAVVTMAMDACANCGFTRVMEGLAVTLNSVALLLDVGTLVLLTSPLEFGVAVAPLLANPAVWITLGTITGVDFYAVIDDFQKLIKP